jgi:hypothetical protein
MGAMLLGVLPARSSVEVEGKPQMILLVKRVTYHQMLSELLFASGISPFRSLFRGRSQRFLPRRLPFHLLLQLPHHRKHEMILLTGSSSLLVRKRDLRERNHFGCLYPSVFFLVLGSVVWEGDHEVTDVH